MKRLLLMNNSDRAEGTNGILTQLRLAIILTILLLIPSTSKAQAAQVIFDTTDLTKTPAQVTAYIATLYVNGTPFVLTDTCVLVTTITPNVIRCTALLPNIAAALTVTGPQNFEVTVTDVILESVKSSPPFVLTRPSVVTNLRIQ